MQPKHPLTVWRESQNPPMSQDALADELDVSRWTINRIETGGRKPSPGLSQKIAALTNQQVPVAATRPDLAAVFGSAA